jgi:hypothetical protein
MKLLFKLFLILNFWITGCAYYAPEPYVPYKTYDRPPPSMSGRVNEPTSLRCFDNSNIFVHCNEAWWWGGPKRGWIPTGGGWYPLPRQVWPDKVYNFYSPGQLNGIPVPVVPYPY